eukprot:gene11470-biopygen11777
MVSRRALELLLESLLAFCSHVVWGLSIHTRRGLNFLVATTGRRMVRLPHQVQEDLTVLEQVVRQYNAKRVVLERRLVDERHFATDASGTLGFGGVWERLFFILSWADLARLPQRPWFPESGVPFQLEHQLPGALCGLILFVCVKHDIRLQPKYINTKDNLLADLLSRLDMPRFLVEH